MRVLALSVKILYIIKLFNILVFIKMDKIDDLNVSFERFLIYSDDKKYDNGVTSSDEKTNNAVSSIAENDDESVILEDNDNITDEN